MLSVNPIEQTQSFKGLKPSCKKVMPHPSDKIPDASSNANNVLSVLTWMFLSLAIVGGAIYSVVNAFSQNGKNDGIEAVENQKVVNSENTLNLSV